MKKSILGIGIMLLTLTLNTSFAQEGPKKAKSSQASEFKQLSPEEKADKRTKKLVEELGLDATQEASIRESNLAHFKEMEAIHEEMKVLKEKKKAQKAATKSEIETVLTADQKAILDEKAANRKKNGHAKKGNHKK